MSEAMESGRPAWRPAGRIDPERIRVADPVRPASEVLDRFRALGDLTSTVSDVLDRLGVGGAVAGTLLATRRPGSRIVGAAITLRNVARPDTVEEAVSVGRSRLADVECHNLARPGDVLVIQSVDDLVSNMGAVSGRIGLRQGEVGAVVDGAVRDVDALAEMGFPVWSRSVSPRTGKYRLESVEVNGPVRIAGVDVRPADVILADDVGVCVVPAERAEEVVRLAEDDVRAERKRLVRLDESASVADWVRGRDAT